MKSLTFLLARSRALPLKLSRLRSANSLQNWNPGFRRRACCFARKPVTGWAFPTRDNHGPQALLIENPEPFFRTCGGLLPRHCGFERLPALICPGKLSPRSLLPEKRDFIGVSSFLRAFRVTRRPIHSLIGGNNPGVRSRRGDLRVKHCRHRWRSGFSRRFDVVPKERGCGEAIYQ
jgi:hypothetical protein